MKDRMSMPESFRVIAIIAAFNEGDIIASVIGCLVENDIEVYLLDNHSSDDTVEQASQWLGKGLLAIEQFPSCSSFDVAEASRFYDWTSILRRKEELSHELPATWFIHHDADEIRESPLPGLTLKEAIYWVDLLGYTAIDFDVVNFVPTDDHFKQGDDPRAHFRYYEEAAPFDRNQIKCWKAGEEAPVSLVPLGGHEARFTGRRVFPLKFLLRHYPIRGQRHGVRKVFSERKPRFLERERTKRWHVQYDDIIDERYLFTKDPAVVKAFDGNRARLNLLLPEQVLRDVVERLLKTEAELDDTHFRTIELERYGYGLERKVDELMRQRAELERGTNEFQAQAIRLVAEQNQLRENVARLEREREGFQAEIGRLTGENGYLKENARHHGEQWGAIQQQLVGAQRDKEQLQQLAESVRQERDSLNIRLDSSETARLKMEKRFAFVEEKLSVIERSKSWRWTALFRWIFRRLGR